MFAFLVFSCARFSCLSSLILSFSISSTLVWASAGKREEKIANLFLSLIS